MSGPTTLAAEIRTAAAWLRSQEPAPRLAVPELRTRFGLTSVEACLAIAAARGLDVRRASA